MSPENARRSAYHIRDAIGGLADGAAVDQPMLALIKAALSGRCATADRGAQHFVVALYAVNQHNVDTAELIWPKAMDDPPHDDEVPLEIIADAEGWRRAERAWLERDPIAWTAFVWRVAVPIAARLGIVGAWH